VSTRCSGARGENPGRADEVLSSAPWLDEVHLARPHLVVEAVKADELAKNDSESLKLSVWSKSLASRIVGHVLVPVTAFLGGLPWEAFHPLHLHDTLVHSGPSRIILMDAMR